MSVDVVILVANNLSRDARVLKEAWSIAAAGFSVARVGIITDPGDVPECVDEAGPRLLVSVAPKAVAARAQAGSAASGDRGGSAGTAPRRLTWRVWAGRVRQNWRMYRFAAPLGARVVIACDLDTLIAGALLKALTGAYLVYDAHELWVDQFERTTRMFRLLFGLTERLLIRYADAVSTVNQPRAGELARRYPGISPVVVVNGPSECHGSALPVGSPPRLLYQGGYSYDRHLQELIVAMADHVGSATLTMQGFGPAEAQLRAAVERHGLQGTVLFVDPCDPGEVVAQARGFDAGFVAYRPSNENNRTAAPNKLLDYLGAGIAVLGARLPMIEQVVEEHDCGVLFDADDPEAISTAIGALIADRDRLQEMKSNAVAACARYLWDVQVEGLLDIVRCAIPSRDSY